MKCMMCESFSLSHICKNCQKEFLTPKLYERKILNNISVYYFYKYEQIESLLHTKHTDLGYHIFNILAKNSFNKFAQNFEFNEKVASIGVDDNNESGYSHSAILNSSLKSKHIQPHYNILKATSSYKYSSKTYQERLSNPRNFTCKAVKKKNIILVDDIITTGLTFTQAVNEISKNGNEVLFCLALASVNSG